ncbi:hypothetical protein PLICRDRAFT_95471 [Plicaturopsis crispa FD-325 SS-3]|uniref:Uncharacterized protein n=1 Tax=Plicaturopsis crispa FD-325 SS-3 TaxID=944288 RepID=A0A0C9SX26_PLICR|nr:hypothetical protein PLICRDRAFT_95471 [Plicaturopsis crispa FD-325 SS-3]
MSASALRQRLSKTASSWPVDPFRPHLQLKNFLESLASHPNLTPRAVEASEVLSRNAIQQKYSLSKKMMQPASMPHHYERLVEGFTKSAQGIGRPRWKIFFGIW